LIDEHDFQKLRALAVAFHEAIEQADFSDTGLNLKDFPVECCHHGCKLLGIFLFGQGIRQVQNIVGKRPDDPNGTHLWLEVDGIVVDITAYQFDGVDEKVIVTPSSDWHSALRGQPVPLGVEGEDPESYFERMKAFYNENHESLYDRLAETAHSVSP
jgi:hypothetical protein